MVLYTNMSKKKDESFYRDSKTMAYKKKLTKQELWKKLQWFIYARVSDPKQVTEWNGTDNQIISCEHFSKEQEIEIQEIFKDEGTSWRLASRAWFDLMMKKLKEANKHIINIDFVVISEYSRFSRNVKLWVSEQMEEEIKSTWCNIFFVRNKLSTGDKWSQMQLDQEKIKAKYESVENSERTIDRMTWRMRLGYYVLPAPVWYEYEKVMTGHKKSQSYIQKKEWTAEIIKEWLEWYANWIYQTKTQLLKFFNNKLLKSNAHNSNVWKLRDTFISRILDINKLYFYAGYIIYPKWWILDPIKAKHDTIISYDILYKIKQKIDSKWKKKYGFREDASELYPLRWVLFCPTCNNSLTAEGVKWNWWIYHYYLCNRKECNCKFNTPINQVHEWFLTLLEGIKPSQEVEILLEEIFKEKLNRSKDNKEIWKKSIKQEIKRIEREMEAKFDTIWKLNNTAMIQRLEEEWWMLNQNKIDLEEKLTHGFLSEIEIKDLYERIKTIITNPIAIREMWNKELKMMLISVLFGGKIYYSKKLGFQTNENQALVKASPIYLYKLFNIWGPPRRINFRWSPAVLRGERPLYIIT